jgi:hypothetical protein
VRNTSSKGGVWGGMKKKKVGETELKRWRNLHAAEVLVQLAEYAKRDSTFVPIKNSLSTRWHANVKGYDFEILCTGPKFWDTRSEKGGGGAVDLVMHMCNVDFRAASGILRLKGI